MYPFFIKTIRKYHIYNPFIRPFFFIRLGYSWLIHKFTSLYYIIYPNSNIKKLHQHKDPLTSYLEIKKAKFLLTYEKSYSNENINSSIDKCFYSKADFFDTIMDKENSVEKEWKTRILFETTPRGNIVIYYDVFKQGFAYYSDINNIPYSILNAVAMKYVMLFNCRDFFVDNQVTPELEPSPFIKIYLEEPKKSNEVKVKTANSPIIQANLFAKYKTYNKNTKSKSIELKNPPIRNIFINQGKMHNFSFIQKQKKVFKTNNFNSTFNTMFEAETNLQNSAMSYKNYKNLATAV
jgi:hypothetical protein